MDKDKYAVVRPDNAECVGLCLFVCLFLFCFVLFLQPNKMDEDKYAVVRLA